MTGHQDSFAEEISHGNQDRVDEFRSFNSCGTEDMTIFASGKRRRELELQKPLLVAMARHNRPEDGHFDADETEIFDKGLCDVAELALQTVGFRINAIEIHKLRALMLLEIRDIDTFAALADHISRYSLSELKQYGLQSAYEQSTYRKAAKKLKDAGRFEDLCEASFIAVCELFRKGKPLPTPVAEKYNLNHELGPAGSDFADGARDLSLYNLVEDLLQIVLAHLDLNRGPNTSRGIRSLLGVFAYTAHHGESIEDYGQSARHTHDLDNALSGPSIRAHIDELPLVDVEEMFDHINQALLNYVIESGVVSRPVMVSYDLTDIQSLELPEYNDPFRTEDGRWRFASLSFTDPSLDFSFGLRLLKSESQRARELKNFLRDLTSMVDVKLFMADRGFDGTEDIEACRAFVPGSWVICAQDDSESHNSDNNSESLITDNDYGRLRQQLDPGGTTVVQNAGFDDLHPPVKLIGYSGDDETADSLDTVRAFYTDMPLPSDGEEQAELITKTNFRYNQRGKIESLFRMAKNKFDVSTDTSKPVRKAFYFNVSVLFYNLYNIVNTVPSPRSGLEISTTQKEFLEVIEHLAFGGPTLPDALRYHRNHY